MAVCALVLELRKKIILITFIIVKVKILLHFLSTESSKYYARIHTAVARGLRLPAGRLAGHQTAAASEHSLCYLSLFSE